MYTEKLSFGIKKLKKKIYLFREALLEDQTNQGRRCCQSVRRGDGLFWSCRSAPSNRDALLSGGALQTCQLDQVGHAGGVHHVLLLINVSGFFVTEKRSKKSLKGKQII